MDDTQVRERLTQVEEAVRRAGEVLTRMREDNDRLRREVKRLEDERRQVISQVDAILKEQAPWRERAAALLAEPKKVHWIVENGTERARTVARQTMRDVRAAMGLNY